MKRRPGKVVQAGGVVMKRAGRRRLVLLVRSSDGLRWLFPKGHVERGETAEQAASREVREEAGVAGVLMDFVCRRRFVQGARRVEVLYYLLDYRKDVKASEDRDTRWCTRAEARRLLSFEQLTRVLDRAWLVHTAAIRRA